MENLTSDSTFEPTNNPKSKKARSAGGALSSVWICCLSRCPKKLYSISPMCPAAGFVSLLALGLESCSFHAKKPQTRVWMDGDLACTENGEADTDSMMTLLLLPRAGLVNRVPGSNNGHTRHQRQEATRNMSNIKPFLRSNVRA